MQRRGQARETQAGVHQGDEWTDDERVALWRLFILGGSGKWGDMERSLHRSIKACRREVNKMHRSEGKREAWRHPDRLRVKLLGTRSDAKWTKVEVEVLRDAQSDGVPYARIAELLGRSEQECLEKHNLTVHGMKEGFF